MSAQPVIGAALADLEDLLVSGQSLDASLDTIAAEHGLKVDVLRARASREGGVIESVEKLRRQSTLTSLVKAYENDGHLFGYPQLGFEEWYERQFRDSLGESDKAFAIKLVSSARERGQRSFYNEMLRQLASDRITSNAQD